MTTAESGEPAIRQSAAAGKVCALVWLFHMTLPVLALWLLLVRPELDLRWELLQNLVWATGYHVVAIPLAAEGPCLGGRGLAPAAAAVLMSVSTIVVAINAQFLRGLDLSPVD